MRVHFESTTGRTVFCLGIFSHLAKMRLLQLSFCLEVIRLSVFLFGEKILDKIKHGKLSLVRFQNWIAVILVLGTG